MKNCIELNQKCKRTLEKRTQKLNFGFFEVQKSGLMEDSHLKSIFGLRLFLVDFLEEKGKTFRATLVRYMSQFPAFGSLLVIERSGGLVHSPVEVGMA